MLEARGYLILNQLKNFEEFQMVELTVKAISSLEVKRVMAYKDIKDNPQKAIKDLFLQMHEEIYKKIKLDIEKRNNPQPPVDWYMHIADADKSDDLENISLIVDEIVNETNNEAKDDWDYWFRFSNLDWRDVFRGVNNKEVKNG